LKEKIEIQILANIRSHVGKRASVIFKSGNKIKVENGLIGNIKPNGVNLLIDGLIHDLIPFFYDDQKCIFSIYYIYNFDLMKNHLIEPMSFKLRKKDKRELLIKKLKKYFNKNLFVVFKKEKDFYVRNGKLLDMGLSGLKLKTSYFEKVNCEYNSIYNIFDKGFDDILQIQ
jgi:hypothetical protein